ncbi:MAG: hypothetical protein ACJ74G_19325 [Blastocatellia bacterium]
MPIRIHSADVHEVVLPPPVLLRGGSPPTFQSQDDPVWCWAACVEMVVKHFGVATDEQCQIAIKGLKAAGQNTAGITCCNAVNRPNDENQCKTPLGDAAITALWRTYNPLNLPNGLAMQHQDGLLQTDPLKQELNALHLVEAGFIDGTVRHVVIIFGWTKNADQKDVIVLHDPENHPEVSILASAIGNQSFLGKWGATWILSKSSV